MSIGDSRDNGREKRRKFRYNARTDVFENLYKADVIDPTKVSRVALENAASAAGMFLTTACVLSKEKPTNPQCLQAAVWAA